MVFFRRDFTPGGTYFFTVTLKNRKSTYLTSYIQLLGKVLRQARHHAHFSTHAIAVLPEHLHVIWELPPGDSNYSARWRRVKASFTKELVRAGVPIKPNLRGEYDLWQRRFWEHRIRDEKDFQNHVDYIHYNPVKHGYVFNAVDWPFSSIHRYIAQGLLPKDWGGFELERDTGMFGE